MRAAAAAAGFGFEVPSGRVFEIVVASGAAETSEGLVRDEIHHPGDGIRAVQSRGTIEHCLDPRYLDHGHQRRKIHVIVAGTVALLRCDTVAIEEYECV